MLAATAAKVGAALLTALVTAGALGGCAGGGGTSAADQPRESGELPAPGFARDWATRLDLKNDTVDRLFVRGGLLFVYTKGGSSYVMKRDTGELLHFDQVPGGEYRLRPPILLANHIVYPTTSILEVYGLDGARQRPVDLRGALRADPVGAGVHVYAPIDTPGGGGSRIRKVDVTGVADIANWELQVFKGGVSSAPAVQDDVVYAADEGGLVYAVTADVRDPAWPVFVAPYGNVFDARAPVTADLKADETGIYVATQGEGRLYCLNRVNGQVKWQWFGTGPLTASPVPTSDTVYQQDANLGMVAINKAEDPEIADPQYNRTKGMGVRWERSDVTQVLAQDDRYTYALRKDKVILALDKKTGETQFTSRRNDLHAFATNPADGTIYAASRGGRVLAIKPNLQVGAVGELVRADREEDREADTVPPENGAGAVIPPQAALAQAR